MPPDRRYVEDSLSSLEENLRFLTSLAAQTQEEFKASKEASYSAAYALMICIEATSGVAAHLLASVTQSAPTGMANSFELLLQEGILSSSELVEQLAKMSRFRNLIVHRYWKVDYSLVYQILRDHLSDFRAFASQVEDYLESQSL